MKREGYISDEAAGPNDFVKFLLKVATCRNFWKEKLRLAIQRAKIQLEQRIE